MEGIMDKTCFILKKYLERKDYEAIDNLRKLCLEADRTTLKLELEYKLALSEISGESGNINEFMCYSGERLVGYAGICHFNGDAMEVNGMVDPEYRRRGIFKSLFSLVKDEWNKRELPGLLMLSDHNSPSGLGFIGFEGAEYDHTEYEMYLRGNMGKAPEKGRIVLRKATNSDAREIARQNSVYFGEELKAEDMRMPEDEEKCGMQIYMAELDGQVIGKVHLETGKTICGIYGLGIMPEYRGLGYGRETLSKAVEIMKEARAQVIMLQVVATNSNALNLYRSCGFEETSTMDYYRLCKADELS
ncbi:MAG TPA: GNAT family N-acetyltransferase [Negativicutes bacterium]|nr:GNAT family N-acetyltransferase [Negativicutes bacterium]